jgi:hypothetical protein
MEEDGTYRLQQTKDGHLGKQLKGHQRVDFQQLRVSNSLHGVISYEVPFSRSYRDGRYIPSGLQRSKVFSPIQKKLHFGSQFEFTHPRISRPHSQR